MTRTSAVWREAAVDVMGKPRKRDWEAYWAARDEAIQAGAELELIGSALAIEAMGEALEQLLDLWWDYEVNGPSTVESGPLSPICLCLAPGICPADAGWVSAEPAPAAG